MKNSKTQKVIKELFFNDFMIGLCFWSFIVLMLIPLVNLPQSLARVLYAFFMTVILICLPFSLYKINASLNLAKKGIEITAANISVGHSWFGVKVKFEYEYDAHKYHKVKYYHTIVIPEEDHLKLLVDSDKPSKFVILEFKKKSLFSIVRERNS